MGIVSETSDRYAQALQICTPRSHSLPPIGILPPTPIIPVAANKDFFQVLARRNKHDDVGKRQIQGEGGEDDSLEGSGVDIFEH